MSFARCLLQVIQLHLFALSTIFVHSSILVHSATGASRRSRNRGLACLILCVGSIPPTCPLTLAQQSTTEIFFEDVFEAAGIDFVHTDGSSGRHYVMESLTSGLALFDYDSDGWIDIYFLNGAPLPGANMGVVPTNRLYRNLGEWKFVDVTIEAQVGDTGYGLGVVAGDFDNDGDADLYVSNYGPNVLYCNNGDGTFSDGTNLAGVSTGNRFGSGASWFDMDHDGDLDLYCANYQRFTFDQHIERMIGGYQFHPGPLDYPPESDNLFRNNGDGTFSDVSLAAGIATVAGTGMATLAWDADEDDDTDIFVLNDSHPNFLFINDGQGNFSEEAILNGLAYDRSGRANGNMGVDLGDVDGDGKQDLLTTTYQGEMPVLYHNAGAGLFDDNTNLAGLDPTLFPHVNWGVSLFDLDNDTDLDAFIACGHFMDNIQHIDDRTTLKVRNYLLQNDGYGRFTDVTADAGNGLALIQSSRGTGTDDLDRDGLLDVVVLNFNDHPNLLRGVPNGNAKQRPAHWLQVQLVGEACTRDAVGAKVQLIYGGKMQARELVLGRSYQSHSGTILHFGLGDIEVVDELSVQWPGGGTSKLKSITADQTIVVCQNCAEAVPLP
ncbi:MAG: CRTAC1 family protein [Planctomycetales bacterium]|nr:CRTAC1 family protein [Planctomycetales bacterium]